MDSKKGFMIWGLRRTARKVCSILFIAAFLFMPLFGNQVFAALYDDFNTGNDIDTSKWNISGTPGLFSQHDGELYFSSSTSTPPEYLYSTKTFSGDFKAKLDFHNFSSDSAYVLGSAAGFTWGTPDNTISIIRVHRPDNTEWFAISRVNTTTGQVIEARAVETTLTSGMLGFSYVGGMLNAVYNEGFDANTGWQFIGALDPGFETPLQSFSIFGVHSGTTGTTSFQLDNVADSSPVPLPPSLFLLAPGLLGVATMRRRFFK